MTTKELLEYPEAQRIFDSLADEEANAAMNLIRKARILDVGLPEIRYLVGYLDGIKVAIEVLRRLRK